MPITLPSYVAPNELIQSAWGNGVVDALDELDDEKVDLTGDTMTGTLNVNVAALATSLELRAADETPRLRFMSQAGTTMGSIITSASAMTVDTLNVNPLFLLAPTTIEHGAGSAALSLRASTETPMLDMTSMAGTSLLTLTAGVTTSSISAFDDLTLRTNGALALTIDGGAQGVTAAAGLTAATLTASGTLTIGGALDHNGTTVGFYGTAPITKQTGVAVTIGAVHAALVALGLIAA